MILASFGKRRAHRRMQREEKEASLCCLNGLGFPIVVLRLIKLKSRKFGSLRKPTCQLQSESED